MTARQVFEYALIELNKVEAPSLLLEDYNYFIKKAILNYVNLKYNVYDLNQQTTDDLGVLKGTVVLQDLVLSTDYTFQGATYTGTLPDDYFHMLSCMVIYNVAKPFKCYSPSKPASFPAKRLAAGMMSNIVNNFYLKPSYKQPYYYIHNVIDAIPPVNPTTPNIPEVQTNIRYGGGVAKKLEIRYGTDNTLFILSKLSIDYLKVPREVHLTQTQIELTEDTSQVLEFPDYVCQEIIKELVKLLMENASDPRLSTNIPVNQTIANPGQSQEQPQGRRK